MCICTFASFSFDSFIHSFRQYETKVQIESGKRERWRKLFVCRIQVNGTIRSPMPLKMSLARFIPVPFHTPPAPSTIVFIFKITSCLAFCVFIIPHTRWMMCVLSEMLLALSLCFTKFVCHSHTKFWTFFFSRLSHTNPRIFERAWNAYWYSNGLDSSCPYWKWHLSNSEKKCDTANDSRQQWGTHRKRKWVSEIRVWVECVCWLLCTMIYARMVIQANFL